MGDGYSYTSNTLRSRQIAGARVRGGRARARIFTVRRLRGRWTRRLTSLAALRAEHENAGPRQIAFGDWERGAVAGFEAPLHPSPPPRSHPPGYAEVPRHENRTKSHERTACRERTISFTPAARAFPRSLGAKSISCPFVRLSCSARSAARLLIRFIAHLLPPRALTRGHESRCRGIALCAI